MELNLHKMELKSLSRKSSRHSCNETNPVMDSTSSYEQSG